MANKRRCLVPETDLVYTIIDVNVKAFLNRFKDKVTNISPLVVAVDMGRITLDNLRHSKFIRCLWLSPPPSQRTLFYHPFVYI